MYIQDSRMALMGAASGQKCPLPPCGRDRKQTGMPPPQRQGHGFSKWMHAAQAAGQQIVLLYSPLPQFAGRALADWCDYLQTALLPWLGPLQLAHLQAFRAGEAALKARCSRLLARALLVRLVMGAAQAALAESEKTAAPSVSATLNHPYLSNLGFEGLGMDHLGRPLLPGWRIAFGHSGLAAFCAARHLRDEQSAALRRQVFDPEETTHPREKSRPCLALDAEALNSPPPAGRAFTAEEMSAPLGEAFHARESLRRWTVKEALLKAAGLGLSRDPYLVHSGRYGQRQGQSQFYHKADTFHFSGEKHAEAPPPYRHINWQLVPCAGHWVCVAAPAQPGRLLSVAGRPLRVHWPAILAELPRA